MKKLVLLTAAVATLVIAGCHKNNPEQLDENVQANANATAGEDLNALSDQAANVASEAQKLEEQANQLNTQAAAADDAKGSQSSDDEDIQGM